MARVAQVSDRLGIAPTCDAFGVSRASFYRWRDRRDGKTASSKERHSPPALSEREREAVLTVLHSPAYVDLAPGQVVAKLLDEKNACLCSERTMYRILAANDEVRERRDQARHLKYTKPELLATAPNQVWSWDITKLRGPVKWTYYYLYVILDLFSRYVVGWMAAQREAAVLAKRMIEETCHRQGIVPDQLTVHADRGSSMRSKPAALLMSDLGVVKSHSRPYRPTDNPYSEAQFKTMKYRPEFPKRFGSLEDARVFGRTFFPWYNTEHCHSGLGMMTPHDVHFGLAEEKRRQRAAVLAEAYERHPERFVRGKPTPAPLPTAVWINPPDRENPSTDESWPGEIFQSERNMEAVLEVAAGTRSIGT